MPGKLRSAVVEGFAPTWAQHLSLLGAEGPVPGSADGLANPETAALILPAS